MTTILLLVFCFSSFLFFSLLMFTAYTWVGQTLPFSQHIMYMYVYIYLCFLFNDRCTNHEWNFTRLFNDKQCWFILFHTVSTAFKFIVHSLHSRQILWRICTFILQHCLVLSSFVCFVSFFEKEKNVFSKRITPQKLNTLYKWEDKRIKLKLCHRIWIYKIKSWSGKKLFSYLNEKN